MALVATPRFGLQFLFASQAQKEMTVNNSLVMLDTFTNCATPAWGIAAPPASPKDGDLYVIPAGATGIWAGKANQLAFYVEGWNYRNPVAGLRVLSLDNLAEYVYAGGTWGLKAAGSGGGTVTVRKSGSGGGTGVTTLEFDPKAFGVSQNGTIATVTFGGTTQGTSVLVHKAGASIGDDNGANTLDFSAAFTITQAIAGKFVIGLANASTAASTLAIRKAGAAVGTDNPATALNFSSKFTMTQTAAGVYGIDVATSQMAVRAAGKVVGGTDNPAATLDFAATLSVSQTSAGYFSLDLSDDVKTALAAKTASAIKVRASGKAVLAADDGLLALDFGADFKLTETTAGYYAIALASAQAAAGIKMRTVGATVATADDAISALDFSAKFKITETTAGYYAVDFADGVVPAGLLLASGGKDVTTLADGKTAVKPATKLNFGTAFKLTPTDGGYYSIDLTAAAAASGGAVTVADHGTDQPSNLAKLNFNGAGVTVTPGTGTAAGVYTITVAGASAGAESLNDFSTGLPDTIQVDGYDNHLYHMNKDWTPTVAAGANPGKKIKATLYLVQDATGGRNVNWPGNIKWDGAQVPILSVAPGKIDVIYLESIDNGATFIGAQIGGNI